MDTIILRVAQTGEGVEDLQAHPRSAFWNSSGVLGDSKDQWVEAARVCVSIVDEGMSEACVGDDGIPRLEIKLQNMKSSQIWSYSSVWEVPLVLSWMVVCGGVGILGLVGPAGCGKTHFSVVAEKVIEMHRKRKDSVCVVSMDAYHLKNEVLDAKVADDGLPLRRHKGRLDTIDGESFGRDLERVREFLFFGGGSGSEIRGDCLKLPVYDRSLHDPVSDALEVRPGMSVIVEGLYLGVGGLEESEAGKGWEKVYREIDLLVFLDVEERERRERVVQRKVDGGRTRDDAEEHFDRVDAPIARFVGGHRRYAHVQVRFRGGEVCGAVRRMEFEEGDLEMGRDVERPLFVVGANPALQRIVEFDAVEDRSNHGKKPLGWVRGSVNRAARRTVVVGGKGQNATRAAVRFSRSGDGVVLLQAIAGKEGNEIAERMERECPGVEIWSVRSSVDGQSTRTCTTLVDTSKHCPEEERVTEMIEPSPEFDVEEDLMRFVAKGVEVAKRAGVVAFLGTAPAAFGDRVYLDIANAAKSSESLAIVILDGYKGKAVEKLLSESHPDHPLVDVLKINRHELDELVQGRGGLEEGLLFHPPEPLDEDIWIKTTVLARAHGISTVLITDGPKPSTLLEFEKGQVRRASYFVGGELPPQKKKPGANPIGAGDTVAGVLGRILCSGTASLSSKVITATKIALAASTSSCLSVLPADFDPDDLHEMLPKCLSFEFY